MQERLFDMLVQKDDITWQAIIYDLVKSEQMDPWDIDISLLAKRYMDTINKLKDHNFFISGKVILASAILLKIKSEKLLTEYIADFDSQLFQRDEDLLEEDNEPLEYQGQRIPDLLIKTPQVRKRKVSLNDLMDALNQALKVEKRREIRKLGERVTREIELPVKKINITELIRDIYLKVKEFFKHKDKVTFSELVGSDKKEAKIYTFVPLLHLDSQQKLYLEQKEHFGEIDILKNEIKGGDNNEEK